MYVDAALPFGLQSAPNIFFNALADGLGWIVKEHGVQYLWHYLDDCITCGAPDSDECKFNLQMLLDICNHLWISISEEKVEGPSASILFLGILIDTIQGELRLPQDKLARVRDWVKEWLQKKRCTNLLSLASQLQHTATVVRPGKTFLRWLFDLSATVQKPHHYLSLNKGARSDLAWWHEFLTDWVSLLVARTNSHPDIRWSWKVGLWSLLGVWSVSVSLE